MPYLILILALLFAVPLSADDDYVGFDDARLKTPLEHPNWFKPNFGELNQDLVEAQENGRKLVVYFGQKRCAYCRALMEKNFGQSDIESYTREHFDIVPVNIWSQEELIDPKGIRTTNRAFSKREGTNFTPSLLFYDEHGDIVLKLRGYYPPYKFRAALEYVADEHYKNEEFIDYLSRADPDMMHDSGELNQADFFEAPPYALDRSRFPAAHPLMVVFERGSCHACDVLHTDPFQDDGILDKIAHMNAVQINMHSDAPVITPAGQRTTAKQWARDLELFYTPTLVFFDSHGDEIIRLDSVVGFYRLHKVLSYVLSGEHKQYPNFQEWRESKPFYEPPRQPKQ